MRRLRRKRARNVADGLHRRGQPWRGIRSGPGAVTVGAWARCGLVLSHLIHLEVTKCAVAAQRAVSATGRELHHLGAELTLPRQLHERMKAAPARSPNWLDRASTWQRSRSNMFEACSYENRSRGSRGSTRS